MKATVFWDGTGHYWTPNGIDRRGPFTGPDSLDDAIRDAHTTGYKVGAVNATRGSMAPVNPAPQRRQSSAALEPVAGE